MVKAEVALAPAPEVPDRAQVTASDDVILRGAVLSRINPAVIADLHLPLRARGLALPEARGIAFEIGLRAGGVLVATNGVAVESPDDAVALFREPARRWQIDLIRCGEPLRLRFRL